ncbi:hypothetical protein [Kocuria sp. KH4]
MIEVALPAIVEAKPATEKDVADFSRSACSVIAQTGELFSAEPNIQNIDVLAYELPGESG